MAGGWTPDTPIHFASPYIPHFRLHFFNPGLLMAGGIMSERFQVAAVVTFYMVAALVMIFVNKAVLNSSPLLPYIFLFLQMLIAVILLHLFSLFSPRIILPTYKELTLSNAKTLTPVVLVNIIGLVFNTLCLRDVDASFFQIARGLVLPLTILVSSFSTRSKPSQLVIVCATIVTFGFFIGVTPVSLFTTSSPGDLWTTFSSSKKTTASPALSLTYGVLSSLFIALHAVLIKTSLPHIDGSTIKLAWWTNAGSAFALIPCILFSGEIPRIQSMLVNLSSESEEEWPWSVFVWGSAVTGVFGFLLCVAGLLSIKVTSPVTHMFSSAAKGVLQTLFGVWIFKDILTVTRAASILVILSGTVLYTWVKSWEGRPLDSRDTSLSVRERTSEIDIEQLKVSLASTGKYNE